MDSAHAISWQSRERLRRVLGLLNLRRVQPVPKIGFASVKVLAWVQGLEFSMVL
jgi:hypothetical protein